MERRNKKFEVSILHSRCTFGVHIYRIVDGLYVNGLVEAILLNAWLKIMPTEQYSMYITAYQCMVILN